MRDFTLAIGGIVARVSARADMLVEFAERCASYAAPDRVPDLELVVHAEPGFENPSADPAQEGPVRCSALEGRYRFSHRRFLLDVVPGASARGICTCSPSPGRLPFALRLCLSTMLPVRGALLLHAAAIDRDGVGLLFAGHSGAGKSTTIRMLADDPLIKPIGDEMCVVQTARPQPEVESVPWGGPFPPLPRRSAPLRRIVFLHRSPGALGSEVGRTTRLMRDVLSFGASPEVAAALVQSARTLVTEVECREAVRPTRAELRRLLEP
jgi:hypothetical protein